MYDQNGFIKIGGDIYFIKNNSIFVHFFSWIGFDGYYCIINCPNAKYLKGLDQNINYDLSEKRIKEIFGKGI